jgi:hypothetical protein
MKYKIFRNLFIDIVNEKIKNKESTIDKSLVKFQNFYTEVALKENEEESGRIDLQLEIREDERFLFEIKIETFTSLTKHQPESYLEFLKNENENLFFILPKGYFHKSKIFERWEEKTKYQKKEIENHNIIYWEDILKLLRKHELDKANVFIDEFCKILDFRWFYFEKIEFTKNELNLIFSDKEDKGYKMIENVSIPVLMSKLFQIIVDTSVKIYIQLRADKQSYLFYGYYLTNSKYEISDKLLIWFGVDYEIWKLEKHPITIQIVPNEEETLKLEIFLKDKIDYKKFISENGDMIFYIPLEKKDFENENEIITEILTDKIEFVINILKDYK